MSPLVTVESGRRLKNSFALAMLPLVAGLIAQQNYTSRFAEYTETPYNTIMIRDTAAADYLYLNNERAQQSVRHKDGSPTGNYWDKMAAMPALTQGKS